MIYTVTLDTDHPGTFDELRGDLERALATGQAASAELTERADAADSIALRKWTGDAAQMAEAERKQREARRARIDAAR